MAAAPALISTAEFAAELANPKLRILDGSYYLPAQGRDARAEFAAAHIPGSQFFDIDLISDRTSTLPHMLPSAGQFASAVEALGIGNVHEVVVYDTTPMFGACRVWWMLRTFGHDRVRVLDGGLPKWLAEGRPVETAVASPEPASFHAILRSDYVQSLSDMMARVRVGGDIVDARSSPRFLGRAPEPRPGLRLGHMPGARNVPFSDLIDAASGCLVESMALRKRFEEARVDCTRDIAVTCGSGITACVVALALHVIGAQRISVYDGSWAEWGSLPDTPIAAE